MPVPAQDKPINQLRQEVIDQLVLNYGHETISKAAFERRLDSAWDAEDHDTLLALTADLDTSPIPGLKRAGIISSMPMKTRQKIQTGSSTSSAAPTATAKKSYPPQSKC